MFQLSMRYLWTTGLSHVSMAVEILPVASLKGHLPQLIDVCSRERLTNAVKIFGYNFILYKNYKYFFGSLNIFG